MENTGQGRKCGLKAGSVNSDGYLCITLQGRALRACRIAFLLITGDWPLGVVDHIDRDRSNNKWNNLRDVPVVVNTRNRNCKGFYWNKSEEKYHSQIMVDGKRYSLGWHDNIIDARVCYLRAKRVYHNEV